MKKTQIIICLLSLASTWGCADFLKEASQDEVIVRSIADYDEFLLGSGYPAPSGASPYQILYLLDDDVEINETSIQNEDNSKITERFAYFTWQSDMWERVTSLKNGYSNTYEYIMGCNAVLDGIDAAIGSQHDRDRIKAEALAVRAYLYFQLVNMYGTPYNQDKSALGVPLKLSADIVENGVKRASVSEVYEQVIGDLEKASTLLEKQEKRRGNYRINYPAVNILLSRVYLYMERWDDAIMTASRAIKTGGILTDYTKIPASETFYFTDYAHTEVEWMYGADNRSSGMDVVLAPSQGLISKFVNGDRRIDLYFSKNRKTVNKQKMPWATYRPANVLRISEAYLNRAEAYARKNDGITNALADLNELRRHRIINYNDVNTSNPTTLQDEIKSERRLELCFEEHRWFDLRRYGMPSITHRYKAKQSDSWIVYTLKEKDPLYILPIPNFILEKNILLQQNSSALESLRQGVVE